MYRILVPLDGSVLADRAIPWADELAGRMAAEVRLIRVITPTLLPPPGVEESAAQLGDVEASLARSAVAKSSRRFRHVKPSEAVVLHGPAGELIAAHARVGADLVVMASHGRSGLARAILGSVAATVVCKSTVPVMVIPSRSLAPAHVPERILVALDGSPFAEGALDSVVPLALGTRATLVLFGVLPLERVGANGWSDLVGYLEETAGRFRGLGLPVEIEWHAGPIGASVVAFAQRRQVDLIAMRTHGRRGADLLRSGSVTEYVLAHAERPVLAVRPLATAGNGAGAGGRAHASDTTAR
jgi:nucleotide-binding universal stress UspA family protein